MTINCIIAVLFTASLSLTATLVAAPLPVPGAQTSPSGAKVEQKNVAPNAEALAMQDFKKRLDGYLAIHRQAVKEAAPMKQTTDPAEIKAAQEGVRLKLRQARTTAKQGDIFTPEISAVFRRILAPEIKGADGQDAKKVIKDDAPPSVPLKVNANYPDGASRPTVPASLLINLPTLPEEVEYRIIDRHLILLDTKAAIIVDYIPNAIP